jgi:hypothetical protein
MEFSASYNTIVGNKFWSNHFNGVGTGSLPAEQTYNVILANVLGPSEYPAGCPEEERPCPSYCPVRAASLRETSLMAIRAACCARRAACW